jgi:hypothetical protein
MACNSMGATYSYNYLNSEKLINCFMYVGKEDDNFNGDSYYEDYNLFIQIMNSCGSAKTTGLRYRRESWFHKLFRYEPQFFIKNKWYNQKDFVSLKVKDTDFKANQRHDKLNSLINS